MRISRSVVSVVFFCAVFCVWIRPALASPGAAEQVEPSDDIFATTPLLQLEVLIREVLARNPSVEAARLAWRAAMERPLQAAAIEQPVVSYGFAPLSVGSSAPFGQEVQVSQRLARRATRELQRSAARAEAEVLDSDLEAVRSELARAAALLYTDHALVAEALRLNVEHVGLLEDLLRSATSRYASGLGSQQDPLQAEIELAHVLHDQVRLRSEQRIVAARINTLLGRTPEARLPPPASLTARHPAPDREVFNAATDQRPEVRSLGFGVEARRAELALAQRAGRPEPTIMAAYNSMWSDQEHRFMVAAAWSVPLWRKGLRAGVSQAEARLAETQARLTAKQLEIESDAWQSAERLRESAHVLELYESRMLPAARDRVKAAAAGLSAGTNDFAAVIEAERELREVELGYNEALADRERHAVELDYASGRLTASASNESNEGSIVPGDQR